MNMPARSYEGRDYLKRKNFPRTSYSEMGIEWGSTTNPEKTRGKLSINDSPMLVTGAAPGTNGHDDGVWKLTYGCSKDGYLALLDGDDLMENKIDSQSNFEAPYLEGLPIADNSNIYELINEAQQIQFIVGRDSADELRQGTAVEDFEARSLCMRAPMHISGWGRTITMRPTDPEPEKARINDDEHKMDRSTWRTGPLDIRWDDTRKMWRAWNDLIADNESKGLGTFVHSTNPDDSRGFPFLRGKLEDVFWVRKIPVLDDEQITGADNDTEKTGTLCIKMDSRILNSITGQTGNLSDVFGVTSCNTPQTTTVGSEVTTEEFLVIRTHTHFAGNFSGLGLDPVDPGLTNILDPPSPTGPIKFISTKPDSSIVTGAMYYDGDGHCDGTWVPGFDLEDEDDEQLGGLLCKLAGPSSFFGASIAPNAFDVIFENDIDIAQAVKTNCEGLANIRAILNCVLEYTQSWDNKLREDIRGVIKGAALDSITEALAGADENISKSLISNNKSIHEALEAFRDQINAVLIRCFEDDSCFIAEDPPTVQDPETFPDHVSKLSVRKIEPDLDYETEDPATSLTKLNSSDFFGGFDSFDVKHACFPSVPSTFECSEPILICPPDLNEPPGEGPATTP